MTYAPRASAIIKQQLSDLAEVITEANKYGTPDFASEIAYKSLLQNEEELHEELKASELIESTNDVEVAIDGDPVKEHTVEAGFFGKLLTDVQNLIYAIAQVIISGPRATGPIPHIIINENRLMVTSWARSSFAVRFHLPTREELHQTVEPTSKEVLSIITTLLKEGVDQDEIIEMISHPRIKKHYSQLLEDMVYKGASIRFRTRANPYGVKVDSRQARDRIDWLNLLQTREEIIKVRGILSGGNIKTGKFYLSVDDEHYSGSVSADAKVQMKDITFGATVTAEMRITTISHEEVEAEPKVEYYLLKLDNDAISEE